MIRSAVVLAIGLLAGCTYKAPSLRVTEVRVTDRSEAGIVLSVSLEAQNRNEVEIPLREIRYRVRLDGGPTISGVRSPEASLRRLGTQTIHFPAVIPLSAGTPPPTGMVRCEVSGDLGYISPGELAQVLFDTGVRRPSVSFRGEAQVDLTAP